MDCPPYTLAEKFHPEGMKISQPKVARHALPWEFANHSTYPERVASFQPF
jgi:hypothetical protein